MRNSTICILLLSVAGLALAAGAGLPDPGGALHAPQRGLKFLPALGKGKAKVEAHETTEYQQVTEYRDKLVTEQDVKFVPKVATESVTIKKPKVVMQTSVIQKPVLTFNTETRMETKAVTKPVFSMEPFTITKPNLKLTTTIGKGFGLFKLPKVDAEVGHDETTIMTPKFSTSTEYVTVPKKVTVPGVKMEDVTISTPSIVMEEQVVQKPSVSLEKVVTEKLVTRKEPVTVTRPVKKTTFSYSVGKGSGGFLGGLLGAAPVVSAPSPYDSTTVSPDDDSLSVPAVLPDASSSSSAAAADAVASNAAPVSEAGRPSRISVSEEEPVVLSEDDIVVGPDGLRIDVSSLLSGQTLPPGTMIRSAASGRTRPLGRRLAAADVLLPPLPVLPILAKKAIAVDIAKKIPKMVPKETIEYVQTTEYRDKVVTVQEIVDKPVTIMEDITVKEPKIIMREEVIQRPKTVVESRTVYETRPFDKPITTMESEYITKPQLMVSTTWGKGKGMKFPHITADITHTPQMIVKPKIIHTTEYMTVPKTITIPVTKMESITVQKPVTVMEDRVITRPKTVMEKVVVEKKVTIKEPVIVSKPVKKIIMVPVEHPKVKGKGSLPIPPGGIPEPSVSGMAATLSSALPAGPSTVLSHIGGLIGGLPDVSATDSMPSPTSLLPGGDSDDGSTSTVVSTGSGDGSTVTTTVASGGGSGAGASVATGAASGALTLTPDIVIIGADGKQIDVNSLKAGDVLPPGATIQTSSGSIISRSPPASAGAGGAAANAGNAAANAGNAAGAGAGMGTGAGAGATDATATTGPPSSGATSAPGSGAPPVTLVTNPDGTISALPAPPAGGSQGGSGAKISWSNGNSTTYVSGIGPFPVKPGPINGFGLTNAGFPVVGNTPVAFLPAERAALYPNANTTINWPCGDKPAGTEIIKGVPCGTDLIAVPTAALPQDEVTRLQGNGGPAATTPAPEDATPPALPVPPPSPAPAAAAAARRRSYSSLGASSPESFQLAGARAAKPGAAGSNPGRATTTVMAPPPPGTARVFLAKGGALKPQAGGKEAALQQTLDQALVAYMRQG